MTYILIISPFFFVLHPILASSSCCGLLISPPPPPPKKKPSLTYLTVFPQKILAQIATGMNATILSLYGCPLLLHCMVISLSKNLKWTWFLSDVCNKCIILAPKLIFIPLCRKDVVSLPDGLFANVIPIWEEICRSNYTNSFVFEEGAL